MYAWTREQVLRHRQILRFLVAGGTATGANIATLYLLKGVLGVWYLLASVVSFSVGFLLSFTLQKFWTFEKKELDVVHKELMLALTVALCNLGINTLLMYSFVDYLHFHYIVAQLSTSALIACETYVLYQKLIFAVKRK